MTHPIPNNALDDRLAFVGTPGSGKTYNAGSGVERLLLSGARVVVTDPLGVWWGLALSSDGKVPSAFRKKERLVIFGGPHGDLPLTEHAGALIGETVAGMAESCILDLSEVGTKAGERRFMLAFLTALYRHKTRQPLHIIFDEADMWAPQRLLDKDGEAAKLLGMMETVVRRGRVKGFIPWLITQRPAVLSWNVLSMIDGVVTFRLTSSHDRDAIGNWVEGQADKAQWKEIWSQLPTMERGEGFVWLPARGLLKCSKFPEKITFDSSRAPRRGERVKSTKPLKPVNIDKLKERLAKVESDAKENDPSRLKAEIAKLKRAVTPVIKTTADPQAERTAYERGFRDGAQATRETFTKKLGVITTVVRELHGVAPPQPRGFKSSKPAPVVVAKTVAASKPELRRITNGSGEGVRMAKAERRILTALAQYTGGRSKNQVAVLAGYAVTGGGFNNAISALRSAGYLVGSGDHFDITTDGVAALGHFDPLPTGSQLLEHWMRQLGKAERETLRVVASAYPEAMAKEEVAAQAGYEPNGGGFNNAISRLRTLELVLGRGELKASDTLFD